MKQWRRDDGVGLVLVIGISVLVFGLVFTAVAMAVTALGQSRIRSNFELSLATAEDGIDVTLARLQRAYDDRNEDYPVPGTQDGSSCLATPVQLPTPQEDPFATAEAESAWAKAQLESIATNPDCVEDTESGEYVVLKPETPLDDSGRYGGFGRVYAMGWSPSRNAAGASERLIKVEYIFLPYAPAHAILASGNLDLDSSTLVTTAAGFDATLAQVHTNGTLSTDGNPTVYGLVSSTEASSASSNRFYANTETSGTVAQRPTVTIPRVSAESFYFHAPNNDAAAVTRSGWWRDLCPDGSIRPYSEDGPCTAPETSNYEGVTGVSYNASAHLWTFNRNASSGVYYVHQANVDVGTGNATFPNMTIVAAAENPDECAEKRYGSIRWDHYELEAPAFNNLFLYADGDLVTHSNFTAGNNGQDGSAVQSGMFVAGDQVSMQTSSQGAVGSVLAAERCNPATLNPPDQFPEPVTFNEVKNPEVFFDPDANAPFTSIINQTLWLEYNG